MIKIQLWLQGKKTYITAVLGAIGAVMAWANGDITSQSLIIALWVALQSCWVAAHVENVVVKKMK